MIETGNTFQDLDWKEKLDGYSKLFLNAALTLAAWFLLLLFSQDVIAAHICGLGLLFLSARLWMSASVSNVSRTEMWLIGYPVAVLLMIFSAAFSLSPKFALVLAVVAGAGWFTPLLMNRVLYGENQDRLSVLAAQLKMSGLWTKLCRNIRMFGPHGLASQSQIEVRSAIVWVDMVAFAGAWLAVSIWSGSANFAAIVLLGLAAISIWTHSIDLSSQLLSQRLPYLKSAKSKTRFHFETTNDFAILEIKNFSAGQIVDFNAEIFSGLCLMLVGAGGSGKTELLDEIVLQNGSGEITFKSGVPKRPEGFSECVDYLPPDPVWLGESLVEFFQKSGADISLAMSNLEQLDPFRDIFPEDDFLTLVRDTPSLAQIQLAYLARNLAADAQILILNAPESHLDHVAKCGLLSLLLGAKINGKILLLASEDDLLMSVADELAMIDRGEIVDRGLAADVRARHRDRYVRAFFTPTPEDAFRLSLWLEALIPFDTPEELTKRVLQVAEEMLLLAPRDRYARSKTVMFDVKLGAVKCQLTMLDHGEILYLHEQSANWKDVDDMAHGFAPLFKMRKLATEYSESQSRGYRQISAVFDAAAVASTQQSAA